MEILGYDVYNHLDEVIEVNQEDILPLIKEFDRFYHCPYIQLKRLNQMDDERWEMNITWDRQASEEISNDIYLLIKGVRQVTLEAIPSEFKHNITNLIEDLGDGKDIKVYEWEDEDGYYRFFLYIDDRIKYTLDEIKKIEDFNKKDYMIGLLLGYSPGAMAEYINENNDILNNQHKKDTEEPEVSPEDVAAVRSKLAPLLMAGLTKFMGGNQGMSYTDEPFDPELMKEDK